MGEVSFSGGAIAGIGAANKHPSRIPGKASKKPFGIKYYGTTFRSFNHPLVTMQVSGAFEPKNREIAVDFGKVGLAAPRCVETRQPAPPGGRCPRPPPVLD